MFNHRVNPIFTTLCVILVFASTFPLTLSKAVGEDPFGSIALTTTPYPLYPGVKNARLDLLLPYPSSSDGSPLYDVNCILVTSPPFSTAKDSFFIGVLSQGSSALAVFYLDVASDATPGEIDLNLRITYREASAPGSLKQVTRVLKFLLELPPDDPFGPLSATVEPDPLVPGTRNARLNMAVSNMDRNTLYNVNATVSPSSPFTFQSNNSFLGIMSTGVQQTVSFPFDINESAAPGAYKLNITFEYKYTTAEETRRVSREVTIVVEPAVDPFGSLEWTTIPSPLLPGAMNSQLSLKLRNEGSCPLYDAEVLLNVKQPLSLSSNRTLVGMVSPGASAIATFYLDVSQAAGPGEYAAECTIRYRYDPDGPIWETYRTVKLPVDQLPEDPFGPIDAEISPSRLVAETRNARLNLAISNPGPLTLHDVQVSLTLSAPFSTESNQSFLGAMSAGDSATAVFYLDVSSDAQSGEYTLPLLLRYRVTPASSMREVRRQVQVAVQPFPPDPFGPLTVAYYPDPLVPLTGNASLYIGLSNAWSSELHDVSLELAVREPLTAERNTSRLGMLGSGAEGIAVYHLNISETASTGEYDLNCILRYRFHPWGEPKESTRVIKLLVGPVPSDPFGGLTVQVDPSLLTPGTDAARLSVTVTNPGAHFGAVLYDVSLLLNVDPSFSLRRNSYVIGTMERGSSATGVFMLSVTGDATLGEHLFGIILQYRLNPSDRIREVQRTIKLRIAPQPASLVVETILNKAEPGGNSTISFKVVNRGGESAKNLVASLVSLQDFPVRPLGSQFYMEEVKPGEVVLISMLVVVDRDTRGNYPMTMRLRYTDSTGTHEQESHLTVEVLGGINPLVEVSRTEQTPEKVMAGVTFLQRIALTNVGEAEARLVQVSLNISYPFTVNGSASNLFVGNLKPGESGHVALQMSVDKNALVGVYSIPFTITYNDVHAIEYAQSGTLGVQVLGAPSLYVESVTVDPSPLKPGQEGLLSIGLTNVGNDVAYDATIRIFGGKGIVASSFAYIAKVGERPTYLLEPLQKRTESALFPLSVDRKLEPGTYLVNITLAYRDDSGNVYNLSKLFEIELVPLEPFVPYFYIGVAGGLFALGLFGYLLYSWHPEEPLEEMSKNASRRVVEQPTSLTPQRPSNRNTEANRSSRTRRTKALIVISCVVIVYAILVVPYIVHVNLGNAGLVTYTEEIGLASLPEGVREICSRRGISRPVLLLVEHPKPNWVTLAVTSEGYFEPLNARGSPSSGIGVEMSDYVVQWHVDWRDFKLVNQTFDRFAVTNVKQLSPLEESIEKMLSDPVGGVMYDVSRAVFYAGPLLLVLSMTLLLQGRLSLWNLPAGLALHSFQTWCMNTIAYQHNLYVAEEWKYFGYLFGVMLPLAFYIWHFERSPGGRIIAWKMKALSRILGLYFEPD